MKKVKTWMIFIFCLIPYFLSFTSAGPWLFSGWLVGSFILVYLLAAEIHAALPARKRFNLRLLNACIILSTAYLIFVQLKMGGGYEINSENYKEYGNDIYWIIPSHLFLSFGTMYTVFTMTVSITRLIHPAPRSNAKFIGTFFQIVFLPIGVWFFWTELMAAIESQRERPAELS